MNPEQAIQAFLELGAKTMIPMHFGTFRLSYEPLDEPPVRLMEKALQLDLLERVRMLNEGEPTVF